MSETVNTDRDRRYARAKLLAAAACLSAKTLAACGGGGGGTTPAPNPSPPPPPPVSGPLVPGQRITGYNMEEQAEMVSDLFLLSRSQPVGLRSNATCASVSNLTPIVKPSGGI